jgi:peroxin-6
MDNNFKDQMLTLLNLVPMAKVQHFMEGRTVHEIFNIRDDFIIAALAQLNNTDNATEVDKSKVLVGLLETICIDKDKARRCKSSMVGRISAVHWTDVGGLDHVREEIRNAIELPLQYPQLFASPHGRRRHRPSGILLYGPPGTGKTFVAKAVATEYGLPFLSVKGPELLGSYVGESEAQVRAIFKQARQVAHENQHQKACILFFDELDSLAPRRGDHSGSGGNVMDRVVASLLIELDKDPVNDAIIFCIGATNRPDMLDPSLLRPGRFDRLVYLGVSASDRVSILTTHLKKLRLEEDVHAIAEKLTPHLPLNLTAADISTISSGALMRATERLCDKVDQELVRRRRQHISLDCDSSHREDISIDDVLASWDKDQLEPVVTYSDLLEVASKIVPSVNEAELKKYDALHDKYKMDAFKNKS